MAAPLPALVTVQHTNGNCLNSLARHRFPTPSALGVLQSPRGALEGGSGHQQLIVGHQQTLRGGVPKRCRSSNLISGIIGPSVFLQITSLSTASIFSCETLIRKFKKS